MDNVAIYGGGFNPIALHHQKVGSIVHTILGFPVWMMPCWSHQYGKNLATSKHRLNMVEIVCQKHNGLVACSFEIEHQLNGAYYHTLEQLKEKYPDKRFHTVIGSDNADEIADGKWVESKRLIDENPFIVIERGQYPPKSDWFLHGNNKYFCPKDIGSSTAIREAIKDRNTKFAMDNLDPDVWDYIQREGLYQ